MKRPPLRVGLGGCCVALAALVSLAWPQSWPMWMRLALGFAFAFLGVVFIETERKSWIQSRLPANRTPAAGQRLRPEPELSERLPNRESFRGRERELETLVNEHQQLRAAQEVRAGQTGSSSGRALLMLIHGKPGVGKTALAQELARRLADEYPDGLVYENLGYAGDRLDASEVLAQFLKKLGWTKIPPSPERAGIFRTLTAGRRILFILDAARDHGQVLALLPNDSQCAAIVTSRNDLGANIGISSYALEELDTDDALDMLHAVAKVKDLDAPQCAGEIVDLCGRLPLALQSAGERISDEGSDLCAVATFLRGRSSRLERLSRFGRNVQEGFATEYGRLEPAEQRAFRLLGQIESATFLPWALTVMMKVKLTDASDICSRLSRAQLIDFVDHDPATGLARFKMHALVQLFAQECTATGPLRQEAEEARRRLDAAYEQVIVEVIRCLEGDFRRNHDDPGPSALGESELPRLIAANPEPWIRAEYPNLARSLRQAFSTEEYGLCWRIGGRLGGVMPAGVAATDVLAVLDFAVAAADQEPHGWAAVDLRIAKAGCLVAVERYADAFEALDQAGSRIDDARRAGPAEADRSEALTRKGRISLLRAEAYLQARCPLDAERELQEALLLFEGLDATAEVHLVKLMAALNSDVNLEDPDGQLAEQVGPAHHFLVTLERFEELRRRRAWAEAEQLLGDAERLCLGDARRQANVLYRRTRLYLERSDAAKASGDAAGTLLPARLAKRAVRRATETVLAFERMGNPAGEIRARTLLVRALVDAAKLTEAATHLNVTEDKLARLPESAEVAQQPLRARCAWARACYQNAAGDRPGARQALLEAHGIFVKLQDGRSRLAVERLFDRWAI